MWIQKTQGVTVEGEGDPNYMQGLDDDGLA